MTAELGDWLTELGESAPATAAVVAGALIAVLVSADPAELAVVSVPGRAEPGRTEDDFGDPRAAVDHTYQQRLEELQHWRREVADKAMLRRGAELRLSEQQAAGADPAVIRSLEERLVAAQQREAALAHTSERLQAEVDAYRAAKETAKAIYTAAEAQLRIAETIEAAGGEPEADLAKLRDQCRAAEQRLRQLSPPTETRFLIRPGSDRIEPVHPAETEPRSPPRPKRAAKPAPGLLELRADPVDTDIRILFAEEPAGTVTLLAVLEGREAISEHGTEAIRLASDLLTEIRHGWPADVDEVSFEDSAAFLARLSPTKLPTPDS